LKSFVPGKPFWWQWPTVLSLDASLIVVAWQWMLARAAGVKLTWSPVFVLGCSVWLAYAADRWIEAYRLSPEQIRTQRHYFAQRHRWSLCTCWLLLLAADLVVAFCYLARSDLEAGFTLLLPTVLYLVSHQAIHRHHPLRLPKEICVAGLLGAGIAVFILARPEASRVAVAIGTGLFVALAFANCLLISIWETEVDEVQGQTSLAVQSRRSTVLARTLPWLIAVIAALLGWVDRGKSLGVLSFCATASAVFFAAIDFAEPRLGRQLARVLVDAALLSPAVPFFIQFWSGK
jgi:hypothetical protein